jgi:hypothetical protein
VFVTVRYACDNQEEDGEKARSFPILVGHGCRLDEPAPASRRSSVYAGKIEFFASNFVILDCVSMMPSAVV